MNDLANTAQNPVEGCGKLMRKALEITSLALISDPQTSLVITEKGHRISNSQIQVQFDLYIL